MKLARNTEWAIVGLLILSIAFAPQIPMIHEMMASPVGKAVALGAIVYVWKFVSQIIAVLGVVLYLKCTRGSVWEGFSGAEDTCLCAGEGYKWDAASKTCKNAEGKTSEVTSCTCISGYSWDGGPKGTKQCVPTSGEQPPLPMTAPPPVESAPTAAPAVSTGPVTSTAPMTTPSAVQDMVASAGPQMPPSAPGGVQPTVGAGTASVPAPM